MAKRFRLALRLSTLIYLAVTGGLPRRSPPSDTSTYWVQRNTGVRTSDCLGLRRFENPGGVLCGINAPPNPGSQHMNGPVQLASHKRRDSSEGEQGFGDHSRRRFSGQVVRISAGVAQSKGSRMFRTTQTYIRGYIESYDGNLNGMLVRSGCISSILSFA